MKALHGDSGAERRRIQQACSLRSKTSTGPPFLFFRRFLKTTNVPSDAIRALLLPIVQLVRQHPKLDDSACNLRRLGRRVCWKALQTPLVVKSASSFLTNTPSGRAKLPEEGLQEWLMSGRLLTVIDIPGASLVKRNAVAFKTTRGAVASQVLSRLNAYERTQSQLVIPRGEEALEKGGGATDQPKRYPRHVPRRTWGSDSPYHCIP